MVAKHKFWAVRVGREGPKIYTSWEECKKNVDKYPSAKQKGFPTRGLAKEYIASFLKTPSSPSTSKTPVAKHEIIYIDSDSDSDDQIIEIPKPPSSTKKSARKRKRLRVEPQLDDDDSDLEIQLLNGPFPDKVSQAPFEPKAGPSTPDGSSAIYLSPEQQHVLNLVKTGRSVFFTGSAGTGKSVLLREIIKSLREKPGHITAITASTGIASVNIGGTTLHSWAGIALGQDEAKKYADRFIFQKICQPTLKRWRDTDTLIIDEISMLDGKLFDKLEYIGRRVRNAMDVPFGGIQLVLSGDFCQLPPVPDRRNGKTMPVTFAFDSKSWKECVGPPVTLTRVFRQKDQAFVDILNDMRFGQLSGAAIETFRTLTRRVTYNDDIEPTELFALRNEVDGANSARLKNLNGCAHTYQSRDRPGVDVDGKVVSSQQMDRLLERLVAPKLIQLKVGAQVMLIKNLEQGHLVNGSVGSVVDFETQHEALASEDIEIGEVERKDETDEERAARLEKLLAQQVWPVVRFTNGRRILCIPQEFTVENSNGDVEAKRDQVPLILAWALSVHKSQGQTIERVRVDLKRIFEKGQAYVALSRATRMEHLQVLNFDPSKVLAHPRVIEWHHGQRTHEIDEPSDEMEY